MQALKRIMSLLEIVADSSEPISATEIAERAGFPLSSVSRLLNQMMDEGLLFRPTHEATYIVGPRIVNLARRSSDRFSLSVMAQPVLDSLRDEVGETVSLHVRNESLRICIATAQSRHHVARIVPVGQSLPLLPGATGEVLLSGASGLELKRLSETAPEIDTAEGLARIVSARERGWSISSNDATVGLTAIAAAVKDERGVVVAALSCSGPSARFQVTEDSEVFNATLTAVKRISDMLALTL